MAEQERERKKKQKKIRDFGREQWSETKGGKKKSRERKNILVSVPGFGNPPFPFLSLSYDAVNDWAGFAAMALGALARTTKEVSVRKAG